MAAETASRGPASALARLIATGLGSGYSPFAPGTAGSLVGLLLYWPLSKLGWPAVLGAALALFLIGTVSATAVARGVGLKDPGIVVVDEVVGMWVSLVGLPFTPVVALAGFVLFRVMDVLKPQPARALERLSEGWGIMADDLMAGLYVNGALRLALWATGHAR